MNMDLEQSLAQLAGSVHDADTSARMNGQVRTMVQKIRRRRAARHTATGVVGVGAAAAVVVGGVQLARPDAVQPPATQPTGATQPTSAFTQCGSTPTDPNPGADVTVGIVVTPGAVDRDPGTPLTSTPLSVFFEGDLTGFTDLQDPEVVLTRDGVVVSVPAVVESVQESFPPTYLLTQPLTACDPAAGGALLPPGDYELVALERMTSGTGDAVAVWDREPYTIEPTADSEAAPPTSEATPPPDAAGGTPEDALAALLAAPTGTAPTCGARMDTRDDGQPPLVLELALEDRPYAPGEQITGTVTLTTTEGRLVIGNASAAGARLLLVKDGVIVGTVYRDAEDATLIDVGPEDRLDVALSGAMQLCTSPMTDAAMLPLPPGTYQAFAVLDVMLKEVQEPNGEAYSITELLPVFSNAVRDVVVAAP